MDDDDFTKVEKKNLDIPSWLFRASNDQWSFGIELKSGTKIGFGNLDPKIEMVSGDFWIHLNPTDMEPDDDTCVEVNGRGMWVRLSQVVAFWERCTT
jgi:hypothetical protein